MMRLQTCLHLTFQFDVCVLLINLAMTSGTFTPEEGKATLYRRLFKHIPLPTADQIGANYPAPSLEAKVEINGYY